jgi:hypothetical protein
MALKYIKVIDTTPGWGVSAQYVVDDTYLTSRDELKDSVIDHFIDNEKGDRDKIKIRIRKATKKEVEQSKLTRPYPRPDNYIQFLEV